jgi:hypothetical protein
MYPLHGGINGEGHKYRDIVLQIGDWTHLTNMLCKRIIVLKFKKVKTGRFHLQHLANKENIARN